MRAGEHGSGLRTPPERPALPLAGPAGMRHPQARHIPGSERGARLPKLEADGGCSASPRGKQRHFARR